MSKLATPVLAAAAGVESSLFLSLFKKKEDESRTTGRPMATKNRKKENVNEEVTEEEENKNSFSSPFSSFSFFYTSPLFSRAFACNRVFFSSYAWRSTASYLHPHKNKKKREKRGHDVVTTAISMFMDMR